MPYTLNPFTGKLDYYSAGGTGPQGLAGRDGVVGFDGADGEDGMTIPGAPGPQGPQGLPAVAGVAAAGEVYIVANAIGTALTTVNLWYSLNPLAWVASADLYGWTTVNGVMTSGVAGLYNINCSLTLQSTSSNQVIQAALFTNGIVSVDATSQTKLTNSADVNSLTLTGLSYVNVGDQLEIRVRNTTSSGQTLVVSWANFNVSAVSGAPGVQGPQGLGLDGEDGQDGMPGATGPQGGIGLTGPSGAAGAIGPAVFLEADYQEADFYLVPGPQGTVGTNGASGAAGVDGADGEDGMAIPGGAGAAGTPGINGLPGPAVYLEADVIEPEMFLVPGPQGAQGPQGTAGGGSVTLHTTTITVPYGSQTYTATVTDASVLVTSNIMLAWGVFTDLSVNAPELDPVAFYVEAVAAGSFVVELAVVNLGTTIGGAYNFVYLIG